MHTTKNNRSEETEKMMKTYSIDFTKEDFKRRAKKLADLLLEKDSSFKLALIIDSASLYYLTGTMQEGIALLFADGSLKYFVRRSYERALDESPLEDAIQPMTSYRDLVPYLPENLEAVYVEKEVLPLVSFERLQKYLPAKKWLALDFFMARLRSVKDAKEIALIEKAGELHNQLLTIEVPKLLKEGMSEADLGMEILQKAFSLGHYGIMKMNMFQVDFLAGQIGFGENALYPTRFDGPGGMKGLHPATPILGSDERKLQKGDLVFVDLGFCYKGYLSDKTQMYFFGDAIPEKVKAVHEACRHVLDEAVKEMKAGNTTKAVWEKAEAARGPLLQEHFMGFGKGQVSFLGHGLGLKIDEAPVIMEKGESILEEGMVIALEPKSGIAGHGLVGVEESYVIEKNGARCLTGGDREIILVDE
jgi:Xaa-Pro aminopeptidase